MRAAPPAQGVCRGGRAWRVVQLALPALGTAALFAWLLLHLQWPPLWAALPSAIAVLVAWRLLPPDEVQLAWDGQCWSADGQPGELHAMLDLGPWLLLRFQPSNQPRACWVAVSAAHTGAAHHGLRAAVYCQRPEPTPGGSPRQP
jgi:hypothetical protein